MVILIKENRVSDINNFLKALVANRNVIGTLKKLIRTNFTEHQYWKVIINCAEHKNNHGRMITLSYNLTLQWLWLFAGIGDYFQLKQWAVGCVIFTSMIIHITSCSVMKVGSVVFSTLSVSSLSVRLDLFLLIVPFLLSLTNCCILNF